MKSLTIKVGKSEATISSFGAGMFTVEYDGKKSIIFPKDGEWKRATGDHDDKTIEKIGKAIEKAVGK